MTVVRFHVLSLLFLVFLFASCHSGSGGPSSDAVVSLFSTSGDAGFFDAPFPVEHMRRQDDTIRYGLLPNPKNNPFAQIYIHQADRETNGFSRMGAVYLPFDGPIDAEGLPKTPAESLREGARVILVNVDRTSSRYAERIPILTRWQEEPTVYVPDNLLMLLPYQGISLAPEALYAAVVLASLGGRDGRALGPAEALVAMREGDVPDGEHGPLDAAAFEHLWAYCDDVDIPRSQVAAATVFRTGEFVSETKALCDATAALPDPIPYDLTLLKEYENYYIVAGMMVMPIWQDGVRPYYWGGGRIHFVGGKPVLQWHEEIRFAVSVPKRTMPAAGFPLLFFGNGHNQSYLQVFNSNKEPGHGGVPGDGPAWQFAHRGIACLDIEAAMTCPRVPEGEFFNFINMVAFRDNIRQASSEFTTLIKMARNLYIPSDLVPMTDTGGRDVRYDDGDFYFWGHSTGATFGHMLLAMEPGLRAGMVSGAGVSWAYNLAMKEAPFHIEPVFRLISGADEIHAFHPFALIFQNVCDPAEAAYYAHYWLHHPVMENRPVNALIMMGIYDLFFPPVMIDGLIAASGTDLAGPLERLETLDALELSGRAHLALPVGGNILTGGKSSTGLALQYTLPDDVDGHGAPFYYPEAKYQYTCFFAGLAETGTATVPERNTDSFAPCGFEDSEGGESR